MGVGANFRLFTNFKIDPDGFVLEDLLHGLSGQIEKQPATMFYSYMPAQGRSITPNSPGKFELGSTESHRQYRSSDGSPLPASNEEIAMLLKGSLPEGYRSYAGLDILKYYSGIKVSNQVVGRNNAADIASANKIRGILHTRDIDPVKHVLIVRSGGAHSIAMARELAKSGYLIIPHFQHGPNGGAHSHQTVSALYFFAKEIADLNRKNFQKNPNTPWAIVLDAHQNEKLALEKWRSLYPEDIPEIPKNYSVIEITEGNDQSTPKVIEQQRLYRLYGLQSAFEKGLPLSSLFQVRVCPYSSEAEVTSAYKYLGGKL